MTFAARVHQAVEAAQAQDYLRLSPAQVEAALMPLVHDLWAMPTCEAHAFIRASFSHVGHEALAVRLYRTNAQGQPTRWHTRPNGQPLDTEE